MGLRAGLDRCGKSRPTGIRSPDCPASRQSLYRLRYPAHTLSVRMIGNIGIGGFVYLKEKLLNVCGGTSFTVADFETKNTNSAV